MILPRPDEIRKQICLGEQEQKIRLQRLNDEETASVRRLTDALRIEEEEKLRSETRVSRYKEQVAAAKLLLASTLDEIKELENRRLKALEPITERENEANSLYKETQDEVQKLKLLREDTVLKERNASKRVKSAIAREEIVNKSFAEMNAKKEELTKFENEIIDREKRLELNRKEHTEHVSAITFTIGKMKKDLENRKLTLDEKEKTLEEVAKQQADERRAIASTYATLADTKLKLSLP